MDGSVKDAGSDEGQDRSQAAGEAEDTTGEKGYKKQEYKKPTIRRHGNLRLMTQLE